jgi:RND family efflux transporter MFP subunit
MNHDHSIPCIGKKIYMNRIQKVIPFALLLAWAGCKQSGTETAITPASRDSVTVFLLQKQAIKKQLSFPAELIPFEKAELFAKVNGYVKEMKVDIGDRVSKGQVLALLEAPEMLSNYAQTGSEAQFARSKYKASLDAYQRIAQAAKVNGTIAAGELERSRNQMLADSAAYESAKSKVNTYSQLKDYLVIRAPFAGTITQRNADPGSMAGTAGSKPLLVVENNALLRLRVPVEEVYTHTIPDTSVVSFTVDAQPDKVFTAKLSRKSGAVNTATRTETWEFIFNNEKKELTSGMYANASLSLAREQHSFVVAPAAVATTLEKKFVIRMKQGKADWVDVRTGMNSGDKIEIFGNLAEGDSLLQKATDEIKAGSSLTARKIHP